ncbi:MAG: hypothetical protein HY831_01455 [Candidatus Aenigmarchaeota archaeon]|nr:hypothetical protein [Candidatus Aenigmarchaeota archaeon]
MFFGSKYDPDKIKEMLEKFGIKSEKLKVTEVTMKVGKRVLVIKNPDVLLTHVMDRDVYQISERPKKGKK